VLHKFGIFEFDSGTGELRKNGRLVSLEPQPARALALLLSKAGDIVTRDELRDAVWGAETHVDFDRGIAYCLSQIRTALGDSGDNPRFVQTVPRRGFKFIAPVIAAGETPSAKPRREPVAMWKFGIATAGFVLFGIGAVWLVFGNPPPPSDRVVVAVSVFDNETGVAEYDRPVAGLSDLVVQRLATLDPARVAVIGNAAVLRQPRNIRNLKAVAADLEADYILLGQLQRGESGLRFITHFIRLRDEAHLKANRLAVADENLGGLEAAVVGEFERAVREHVLTPASN
jgi:DNA-binding winged helix-turn-helix (wHTH) protein/TolB-like protein